MIFDVDGTLVDSNDAHARAWVRAFAEHGIPVAYEPVRRAIGMGGDKLMPRVSGIAAESERGKAIAESRAGIRVVAFECGGWRREELDGAVAFYRDAADLLAQYAQSGFAPAHVSRQS